MADDKAVGAPALDTNIESGRFDEKRSQQPQQQQQYQSGQPHAPKKSAAGQDDDEDEDIDALIEDLESQDGHGGMEEEDEEDNTPGGGRVVPEDMLQTDSRVGLTESEVTARRRKYGLNQMKEEKENLFLKFLSYFIGPIQFVMEVSGSASTRPLPPIMRRSLPARASPTDAMAHGPPGNCNSCAHVDYCWHFCAFFLGLPQIASST